MNIFKRRSYLMAALALLLVICGCTPSAHNPAATQSAASGKQLLRVGISTNSPPFVYKHGNNIQGLEIDFARQLAKYLGREVVFVELSWMEQLPALEKGQTDIIMSGMTITHKRQYRVAFTTPYMRSGQMLLVRTTEARRYAGGIYSLMGETPAIGVIEGTTGDFFITKTINKPDLTRFSTSQKAVEALATGKIDAFVHDTPMICHYAATYEGAQLTPILQMFTEEYLAWAVNKGNPVLLEKVNTFIEERKQDQSLQATIARWIPYL